MFLFKTYSGESDEEDQLPARKLLERLKLSKSECFTKAERTAAMLSSLVKP
ncbi:MAG: hypothetical protein GDA51_05565 [Ekhidna sp.]|nr:hypothetical protein [Ekhidna sp.]